MTAEDLEKIRDKHKEIRQMKQMLNGFLHEISPSAVGMERVSGSSGTGSTVERTAERNLALQKHYLREIEAYHAECVVLEKKLSVLTVDERNVIRAYYLDGNNATWQDVGDTMHYSMTHVFRIRRSAMQKLSDI